MEHVLKYKLLNLPLAVWGLQILYVAVALGLFLVIFARVNTKASHLHFQILYVLVMFGINIAWRVAVRNLKPDWF